MSKKSREGIRAEKMLAQVQAELDGLDEQALKLDEKYNAQRESLVCLGASLNGQKQVLQMVLGIGPVIDPPPQAEATPAVKTRRKRTPKAGPAKEGEGAAGTGGLETV